MGLPLPLAAAAALGGNALLSLGMVLQKRNVAWLGAARPLDRGSRRAALGWLAGFMLVNAAPAFNYLALLGLPPNVVSAAAGSNVAFTALFAAPLLGERLGPRRAAFSALLFGAIALAGLRGGEAGGGAFSPAALYAFIALPAAAAALAWALLRARRGRAAPAGAAERKGDRALALLFAAVAGSCGGYMVLPMRALQLAAGGEVARWLSTPYPYLFLAGGIGGFVHVQVAYREGEMASVAPLYYGLQVLWPALASYFVFSSPFDPLQAAAFLAIAAAIALISRGS